MAENKEKQFKRGNKIEDKMAQVFYDGEKHLETHRGKDQPFCIMEVVDPNPKKRICVVKSPEHPNGEKTFVPVVIFNKLTKNKDIEFGKWYVGVFEGMKEMEEKHPETNMKHKYSLWSVYEAK